MKGTSKRIVVVKSPDPTIFEQAFFVVREDFHGRSGRANALKEAQKVANDYVKSAVATRHRLREKLPLLAMIGGALLLVAAALIVIF